MGFRESYEKTLLSVGGPAGAADHGRNALALLPPAIAPPPMSQREAAARAADLAFKRRAAERLKAHEPGNALMLLDGLERFYEGGEFWLRKNDGAGGNRCLVGGIEEARLAYNLGNSEPAHYYLRRAIDPQACAVNLPEWNAKCESFAKLRAVIEQARRLAEGDQERLREIENSLPVQRPRRWWRG
jgi:hypothetical protein